MVERRKQPTTASQYCVRGTDSLLYQREHLATRWDGALELGVNYMGNSPTVPFNIIRIAYAQHARLPVAAPRPVCPPGAPISNTAYAPLEPGQALPHRGHSRLTYRERRRREHAHSDSTDA